MLDPRLKATDQQIGGDHYKKMKIQPFEFSMANKLDPIQHTIIKYVTRYEEKKGLEDLQKAKHCVDLLIQFKYGSQEPVQIQKVVDAVATAEELSASELVNKMLNHNIRKLLFKKLCFEYFSAHPSEFVDSVNQVLENHANVDQTESHLLSICLKG